MKRKINVRYNLLKIFLLLFTFLTVLPADAADALKKRTFGLGALLGEPTGVSFKKWNSKRNAIDGALAWSLRRNSHFYIHVDYLIHSVDRFIIEDAHLPLYFGIGVVIQFDNDTKVGVRLPGGINYFFKGSPVEVFLELAPVLDLIPGTEFDFSGGIGIRYYF